MYISGGENVYPAEIEAVVVTHPAVAECAVVGRTDERWGEVGHLFIVTVAGVSVSSAELLAYLQQRLAKYKLPKQLTFLDVLPRNGAGKVLKGDLSNLAREHS
jgi:fatty-acyl-CoA synthase